MISNALHHELDQDTTYEDADFACGTRKHYIQELQRDFEAYVDYVDGTSEHLADWKRDYPEDYLQELRDYAAESDEHITESDEAYLIW